MTEGFDLASIGRKPARRLLDVVNENVADVLSNYANEDFQWEALIVPMPQPPPQNVHFGLLLLLTMPMPVVGDNQRFLVSQMWPDLLTLHDPENVRAIMFQMTQQLRAMHADFLRGNQ